MGLAANQARMLTLTSRMNDLERNAQLITNQKLLLTALSGNASIKYNTDLEKANGIGADIITLTSTSETTSQADNSSSYTTLKMKNSAGSFVNFDYNTIKELGYDIAPKGSTGKKVSGGNNSTPVSNNTSDNENYATPTTMRELMNLLTKNKILETGSETFADDGTLASVSLKANRTFQFDGFEEVGPDKSYMSMVKFAQMFAKDATTVPDDLTSFNKSIEFDMSKVEELLGAQAKDDAAAAAADNTEEDEGEASYEYDSNDLVKDAKSNSLILLQGLLDGSIGIFKDGKEVALSDVGIESKTESTGGVSTSSSKTVTTTQTLDYSRRDAARAKAEKAYASETNRLKGQEKGLDVQQKAVETEYAASSTEFESVKKLVGENAEKSFSLFG